MLLNRKPPRFIYIKNKKNKEQTSFRKIVNASPTYGTDSSGMNSLTFSTSVAVLGGSNMTGPFPFMISKGMFIPESGVRISENKMTCQHEENHSEQTNNQ